MQWSPLICKNPIWAKSSSITSNFNKASFCDILKFFGDISPGKCRQWEEGRVFYCRKHPSTADWDPTKCVHIFVIIIFILIPFPGHKHFHQFHEVNMHLPCFFLSEIMTFQVRVRLLDSEHQQLRHDLNLYKSYSKKNYVGQRLSRTIRQLRLSQNLRVLA